jgi:hypothetical protein
LGEPSCDAPDDTLTIEPPRPPRFVDIRRTASRAAMNAPTTLILTRRSSIATWTSSTRPTSPTIPALLTSSVNGPSASAVANAACIAASSATSAQIAVARPPAASTSATTRCASSARSRYVSATA